jgi:hypothetical protein
MRKTQVFGLAVLLTATAWGGDVSGKWTGGLLLDTGNHISAYVHLKQVGEEVTGTEGPSEDNQFPITTGRMDGERLVIEAKPGPAVLRLSMKLDGNKLIGDVFEDERKIGTVSLQKADR